MEMQLSNVQRPRHLHSYCNTALAGPRGRGASALARAHIHVHGPAAQRSRNRDDTRSPTHKSFSVFQNTVTRTRLSVK
eukprot:scaffold28852_cov69-Phaeocystis_antarctica.AAC.1